MVKPIYNTYSLPQTLWTWCTHLYNRTEIRGVGQSSFPSPRSYGADSCTRFPVGTSRTPTVGDLCPSASSGSRSLEKDTTRRFWIRGQFPKVFQLNLKTTNHLETIVFPMVKILLGIFLLHANLGQSCLIYLGPNSTILYISIGVSFLKKS